MLVGLPAIAALSLLLLVLPRTVVKLPELQAPGISGPSAQATSEPPATSDSSGKGRCTEKLYIVQKGDTLTKIAKRHGLTLRALLDANDIADPDKIYVGQKLRIPCAEPGVAGARAQGTSP